MIGADTSKAPSCALGFRSQRVRRAQRVWTASAGCVAPRVRCCDAGPPSLWLWSRSSCDGWTRPRLYACRPDPRSVSVAARRQRIDEIANEHDVIHSCLSATGVGTPTAVGPSVRIGVGSDPAQSMATFEKMAPSLESQGRYRSVEGSRLMRRRPAADISSCASPLSAGHHGPAARPLTRRGDIRNPRGVWRCWANTGPISLSSHGVTWRFLAVPSSSDGASSDRFEHA
jgi:hypothetical protein